MNREQMDEKSGSVDFASLLEAIRRRFLVVFLCVLVGTGLGLGLSLLQNEEYSATASLLFRDPGFDERVFGSQVLGGSEDSTREAATNLQLVSLDVVAEKTAADLQGESGSIDAKIDVEPQGESNVVSLTATDPDPESAAELANVFAANYVDFRRQADRRTIVNAGRLVQEEYDALGLEEQSSQEGEALQKQISRLKTLAALQTGNAEVVQRAEVPGSPSSPRTRRNTVVGFILGLLFGLGLAAFLERADRRLRRPEEIQSALGLPVLGTIPESKAFASPNGTTIDQLPSTEREAFRMLRTRLRYFNVDRELHSVLVGSATLMDGKSTLSLNLAAAAASAGTKTLLLEADFHRPVLAQRAGS
ncbi:MAG: YveK family protein, partial [Actinomycetota bacterium]